MALNPSDIVGRKFERLLVVSYAGRGVGGHHEYNCRCDCGNEKIVRRVYLRSGHTRSCGCLHRSVCWVNRMTHGETIRNPAGKFNSPEYRAWSAMKARCSNPKHPAYHNYGGRGITVSAEWADSFELFLRDVGRRPSRKHSLDRFKNNLGYFKGNVGWVTKPEQDRNRRTNRHLQLYGKTQTLTEWCLEYGISKSAVCSRLASGWSVEAALTTKPRGMKSHGKTGRLFSAAECESIRNLAAEGLSRSEIARRLGVTTTTISRVVDKQGAYENVA